MLHSALNEKSLTHLKHWTCKSARKRFSMLSFVAIMVIGTFAFANNLFFLTARATYVAGGITQNTVWTLVDSPFEVSQNVTVYPSATLTIESGVEVRFGEDFSLVVSGRLVANGTHDSMITFTSNKYQPGAGDWGTIEFNGTQPSVLAYCSIKYATNGITAEHGNVEVKNSVISNDSQYGIFVANSTALIQSNEIGSNFVSGVYLTGNVTNQVAIQNNTISSNTNGILLDGTNSSGVSISNNILLSNNQSGIQLNADAYKNLIILYNNISANDMGFYISGQANYTWITNNSISYNSIGFHYAGGQGHQAHWNDIHDNVMGMDVSSDATGEIVNATYNYWGDPSGPYHVSLNPAGKGNPVGGDGVNLVFVFFLTQPINYVNQSPIASLWADKRAVPPNQPVTFIGTLSSDDGRVDQYFFNFGDGKNSSWTTLSIFVHNYSSSGNYIATLKVMDDFGVMSINTATVQIMCLQGIIPLTVSLISSGSTIGSEEQLSIAAQVTDSISPVADANVTLFSTGGSFTSSFGLTNSTGYFTTTFLAPNVAQVTNIRITASASEAGHGDGSDYKYLVIVPLLFVQVTANPKSIKSEMTSNVTARVTGGGTSISGAAVSMLSSNGSFAHGIGLTDANGNCTLVFAAPETKTPLNVSIIVTATENGYVDAQGQTNLAIEPKVLLVQVVAAPSVNSEMSSNVTAHVSYDSNPISGAIVVLSSNMGGSFVPTNGTTNALGLCTFTFTAPQVTTPSNVTITASASETGYADGVNQTTLNVKLGTLIVQMAYSSGVVESGQKQKITVHVTYNTRPVANTVVTLSSGGNGTLSPSTNSTDQNGDCQFVFTAPETTAQNTVFIAANATKNGYVSGQSEAGITVNAAVAGPPLTILFVIIAVIIVAIVLVLIKLKILVISSRGE